MSAERLLLRAETVWSGSLVQADREEREHYILQRIDHGTVLESEQ